MWKFALLFCELIVQIKCEYGYTIHNPIRFPVGPIQGPFMGIFVALAMPLEDPEPDVFFSYNVEANYNLPQNQTTFTYPPILSDDSKADRRSFYKMIEFKLEKHGLPSRDCLLRTICEAAEFTMDQTGVLGDLVHILLTPSTSTNKNLSSDYITAEEHGKTQQNCIKYHEKCSISLIGLISTIQDFFHEFAS